MAYYKTHVIAADETIQDIATHELGDITVWTKIVALNNLYYPYIVATREAKLANPEHLLTVGDVIKLPSLNLVTALNPNTLDLAGRTDAYDMAMGMDLGLTIEHGRGLDDSIAYLTLDHTQGDLTTVKGEANLRQSIKMRMLTRYGSLPYHPNYGSHILDFIGQLVNDDTVALLKLEIERTAKTDKRVATATVSDLEVPDGRRFFAVLKITPIGEDEAFEMFLENAQNGEVKMT